MAGIVLDRVSKRFGSVDVIRDLSLEIGAGEFVVFLGPSVSGKTTLLRMIAGLESIGSGTLTIDGVRSEGLAPGQRNLAMVFQNYALYPHMTVAENMAFGLRNIGLPAATIKARVAEAARMLAMEKLLARRPAELSGGQRQRVAIGRAIVKEPKAFLFDEPLSNLDAGLRVRTRVELAELHQRLGSTMIYVTHDQTEAMTLADRIVILNNCRIEQVGTPMEVYSDPASRFVASFIGSPAMNFLPVTLDAGDGRPVARLGDGSTVPLPALPPAAGPWELGIRPEALTVAENGPLRGTATVVERLGDRTLVYARLGDGSQVIAQDRGKSAVRAGDAIGLAVDPAALHLFDAEGRAAPLLPGARAA
ncbi:ABC transporter ATP-binding protein [Rhodobacter calidifons]|uniref:Sn-glycerol-3-phosphate ABC transporter ATP-binding protein UgpC n=1 Tax=Rhodobacter calidifons TaxID=2715277 RepID=A0ABX0G5E7_9RHOB|nr:sn-glycerol-3-phosphate ABC transporter ATP-binding protein UgpC [Rhodobacter calidifons]NHB76472.1 sn-glycerol-3-phosphate ABC transporter ATP-binding protein UgpC [Rhodobacter calidifons]